MLSNASEKEILENIQFRKIIIAWISVENIIKINCNNKIKKELHQFCQINLHQLTSGFWNEKLNN